MNSPGQPSGLRFAVLGHPVAHSRSPAMHASNFQALGLAATYTAFDVTEAGLAPRLETLRREHYLGVNLVFGASERHEADLNGFSHIISIHLY